MDETAYRAFPSDRTYGLLAGAVPILALIPSGDDTFDAAQALLVDTMEALDVDDVADLVAILQDLAPP